MPDKTNSSWQLLSLPFDERLHETLLQQHHAAQFIASVGRQLIPQEQDDSNTSMNYDSSRQSFIGNQIPGGYHIELSLAAMIIRIIDINNDAVNEISLTGMSKREAFAHLKKGLANLAFDLSGFSLEMHYDIPKHGLDRNDIFTLAENRYVQENIFYRHNAELILEDIASKFRQAEPVRVWPHHFDTGSFIPLEMNDAGGVSRSMGLGWAIPDHISSEPYYYLTYWSEAPMENFSSLSPPEAGQWSLKGLNGATLTNCDILKESDAGGQEKMVRAFFNSSIRILMEYLNL